MTWLNDLTGLDVETHVSVKQHLRMDGQTLVSGINGRRMGAGRFSMCQLASLRGSFGDLGPTTLREVVGDVQELHKDPANAGALFQVASQFNMLEMVGPNVTPEDGVGGYEYDRTQGPACAIACGAGTIFRNYFVTFDGGIGQTADRQLNGLADVARMLGNETHGFWDMVNGYVVPRQGGLSRVSTALNAMDAAEIDALRAAVRVGLHKDVEVTLGDAGHTVSQIYCSAMPVAYSVEPSAAWRPLACLVLEAAYEATLFAACQNAATTGNRRVFLTLLGGGAFGNQSDWIIDAAVRALQMVRNAGLDVRFVSYREPSTVVQQIINQCSDKP